MTSFSLLGLSLTTLSTLSTAATTPSTYTLPSSCSSLADGSYYMKLGDVDDNGIDLPIIKAKCSSGYTIIDVNYDSSMTSYFTSWAMWHSSIAGPTNSDIVDWDSWYLPSRSDGELHKFLLSPDCTSCDVNHIRQHFNTRSTYWMSGNLFGCYWMMLGKHNCDLDKDTYACYDCSESSDPVANGDAIEITEETDPNAYYFTGQCATAIRSSNSLVTSSHDTCQLGLHYSFGSVDGDDYENEYKTNVISNNIEDVPDLDDVSNFIGDQFANEIFKPSLGTDGRFCVCSQSDEINEYIVDKYELEKAMIRNGDNIKTFKQFITNNNEEVENVITPEVNGIKSIVMDEQVEVEVNEVQIETKEKTSENNRVELTANDFKSGTYRIKESGTYVIMEDIEFNFNAGSLEDPQAPGAWKPRADQADEYPGAESGRDEYFLGFFAGITIECDDVILDLNGYEIGMSNVFFLQQRWFTVISLTSQFFLPGNGPGFFGYNPRSASNVIIKDGTIGLSSHFGIHGNYNKNILISNVHVKGFEVHGIQFNGFEDLTMKNVEVGPSTTQAYLTGEYGHMRYVLDRLNNMISDLEESNELDTAYMYFQDRTQLHVKELSEKCERMMNYAFNYVVKNMKLTIDDFSNKDNFKEYLDAIDIFVNPSGIPYASVLHGIFLNTKEASVMTYNLYTTTYSYTANLENIQIHDLQHSMDERVRMYNDIYMFFGPFLNCLNARQLVGDEAVENAEWGMGEMDVKYQGSIVTDVYLALTKYSNNWDYLEKMLTGAHIMVPWAEGETNLPAGTQIACNMDVMIHSGKGTTGLRLDGVQDVTVNGLEIYNLHDSTPSGETVCGEYTSFTPPDGGGHLAQQSPMQVGFSGNKVQAVTFNSAFDVEMNNVKIYDLESETGPVTGLTIWPANDITLTGDLYFSNFQPSTQLDINDETSDGMSGPNWDHFSCGVFMYESYYKASADVTYTIDVDANLNSISTCNVNSGDWSSECYKFIDSTQMKSEMEEFNELYSFLQLSNEDESTECSTNLKHKSIIKSNNKILNSSTPALTQYSPSLVTLAMFGVIIVIVGATIAIWLFCTRKENKYDNNLSKQSFISVRGTNYGTI